VVPRRLSHERRPKLPGGARYRQQHHSDRGWRDLDLIDIYDDVQITSAREDGTPSPWTISSAHLTTGIYGHATLSVPSSSDPKESLLLSVGGQPGTGAYANWISFAYARFANPGVGIWRIAPTGKLSTGLAGLGVAELGTGVTSSAVPMAPGDTTAMSSRHSSISGSRNV